MTECEAFLRAMLSDPEDDTPRLVFADWLQENGQPDRAASIRDSIAEIEIDAVKWFPHEAKWTEHFSVSRGFIERIWCTAIDWFSHADEIYWHPKQPLCPLVCPPAAQPIREVKLTGELPPLIREEFQLSTPGVVIGA